MRSRAGSPPWNRFPPKRRPPPRSNAPARFLTRVRSTSTLLLFFGVLVLSVFAVIVVWPSEPGRYLPGDFWPQGRGFSVGSFDRTTMRLGLDLRGGTYLVLQADPPADYNGNISDAIEGA